MPQDVQHRQVGDGLPVGEAAPGEVRQSFPRQALAELIEQARLAHARFGDNPDHLSLTGLDLRQHLVQHRQLTLSADKPAQGTLPQAALPANAVAGGRGVCRPLPGASLPFTCISGIASRYT